MSEQDHHGSGGETGEELPLEVVELLCSRLCHDLISPVGAINNGMELLGGEDQGVQGEVMEMIAHSGKEAAALRQVENVDPEECKAWERAETILGRLDPVRHALLIGTINRQPLQRLSPLARVKREQFNNPHVMEMPDEIELRAEVEPAKYDGDS